MQRCLMCKQKMMVFIDCKCGLNSCIKCNSKHNCNFDYFSENQKNLKRSLHKIEPSSVDKI